MDSTERNNIDGGGNIEVGRAMEKGQLHVGFISSVVLGSA